MAKFNVTKALTEGTINLVRLEGSNNLLLAIISKEKEYLIPLIKNSSGARAYISDELSLDEYDQVASIINSIFDSVVYKDMYSYTPIRAKAPEFSKKVTNFLKPTGGVKNIKLEDILIANGFDVSALHKEIAPIVKRDYSELLKDEKAAEIFATNKKLIDELNIKYEDLSPEIKVAYEAIESGRSCGIIFEGPTGTGKSFVTRVLANHAGAPLLNIQIGYGTEIEDLIGGMRPNDDPTNPNKYKFVPGPLLVAATEGYQIVIEEVNFGQPGIIAKLNEFTDFTPYVIVDGKIYKKHPNFVCYMTMNPGYEGTEILNVALKNRFSKVSVPALTETEYCKRAMSYSKMLGHELSYDFFKKLYQISAMIEKEACSSKWHENVKFSIRNAQRLCNTILIKKRSLDEFKAAIAIEYLNDLSTDNDNSIKLEEYKNDSDILNEIKTLYELYDFSEIKTAESTSSLADLFTDEEKTSSETAESKEREKTIDSLFEKFGK